MRSQHVLGLLTMAATLAGSGNAFAQECATREQVQAELRQALRDETILSGDSSGAIALEHAARHPAPPTVANAARQRQVQVELADALRNGTILAGDGTMWQDLGQPHQSATGQFFASTSCPSGTRTVAGTDR